MTVTLEICVRQTAWLPIGEKPAGEGWDIHSGNVTHNSWHRVFPLNEMARAAEVICREADKISGHDLTDEMIAAIETLCPIVGMPLPWSDAYEAGPREDAPITQDAPTPGGWELSPEQIERVRADARKADDVIACAGRVVDNMTFNDGRCGLPGRWIARSDDLKALKDAIGPEDAGT